MGCKGVSSEGSDTRRNLVHFGVKSLEIFAEIRKSYSKSQSEILKLTNFPYFKSVNFHFLVHGGGISLWAWPNGHGHAQILSTSAQADHVAKELIVDFFLNKLCVL